ncbi:MAG: LysE family transporter [Saprospiraceae bacterium]|nr:LysE family transporter [Saprospiraceae bacterium]MDZ4705104.1 LysE family transporter [Saprospiraceae bacterium]
MNDLLWRGLVLGLSLSFLVGPMMVVFIQVGVERGFRAAIMAAFGSWTSDVMYIFLVYFGISYIFSITKAEGFQFWSSLAGGLILVVIGLAILFRRPVATRRPAIPLAANVAGNSSKSYFRLWLMGFVINTINPFPVFFWLGVMSSAGRSLSAAETTVLFGSIVGTVIFFDLIKVLLAKRMQRWVRTSYIGYMRRFSGAALVVLGVVLIIRGVM